MSIPVLLLAKLRPLQWYSRNTDYVDDTIVFQKHSTEIDSVNPDLRQRSQCAKNIAL